MACMAKARTLIEQFTTLTRERVDRDGGIIYGVKVCGLVSKNGRTYTPESLKSAVSLYEGASVNIDHPSSDGEMTSADRRFGQLKNVRWSDAPSPGLYADLHYLKSHPLAERVAEAAERMPTAYGLSHNAYAADTEPDGKGGIVVKSLAEVQSVDLVADPATNSGLFESRKSKVDKKQIKAVLESSCVLTFQKKRLAEFLNDKNLASYAEAEMDAPAEDAGHEENTKAAFKSIVMGILDDESMDLKSCLDKIKTALQAKEKMLGGGDEPAGEPVAEDDGEKEPEKKDDDEKKEAVKLTSIDKAISLCEQLEIVPDAKLLKVLVKLDEATAKEVAEQHAKAALGQTKSKTLSAPRLPAEKPVKEARAAETPEELSNRIFG